MNHVAEDILMHYGMPKRSGRYPWGSGEEPYQHSGDFLSRVNELKKQGLKETEIAKQMGLSTTQLRVQRGLARVERRSIEVDTAQGLREKGYSLNEIAEKMGYKNDSSVRSLLNENSKTKMNEAMTVANFLKERVDEKGMIDVGSGVETSLNISKEKLKQALTILEMEGYPTYGGGIPQATNRGRQTNTKVLCPPGTEHKEIFDALKETASVGSVDDYIVRTDANGKDVVQKAFVYPKSMDGNRVKIRYAEEGGIEADGLIEIRRNVEDLSLGRSTYAQVRILVDDTKYLKGMAAYSDDIPDGYDIVFNTNKKSGTPKEDVLKNIKDDPDNPFGSLIKEHGGQSYYIDKNGKEQLSLINKRAEEGDWNDWADKLPSQFLAKQNYSLVQKQLNMTIADKQSEFDEIMSYNNPTVKKMLLKSFADDCDASAVHLRAAALPRQKYRVLIPIGGMKDNEVYAPSYEPGEKVALVRFPHGGTFEIPILTVNNKHKEARNLLGTTPADAVGINAKVAERLSGADFDGDTVLIIPTGGDIKITSTPPLKGLENFDPKMEYGGYAEDPATKKGNFKLMKNTQNEMGKASNLITDMQIKGAPPDDIARAVRHSMVVIDAEKHKLNYLQSYKDNGIAALRKKYMGHINEDGKYTEGASTLLSRAKNEVLVIKRQGSPIVDKETGEVSYKTSEKATYVDKKTGKTITRTQPSTQMAETRDARTLLSGTGNPKEEAYAAYANSMKSMANTARKEAAKPDKIEYSAQAKKTYAAEVEHLDSQYKKALMNAPRERQAQILANSAVAAKKLENPDMKKGEIKKASQLALTKARNIVGAKRTIIEITDRDWEAIQAGSISENRLLSMLGHADPDRIKELAMPRTTTTLSTAKINKITAMSASNYSISDIAKALNVSATTVSKYLKEKE